MLDYEEIMEEIPFIIDTLLREGGTLAGGALISIIRQTDIRDWDVFFPNKDRKDAMITCLELNGYTCNLKVTDDCWYCSKDGEAPIELIFFRQYDNPMRLLWQFDMAQCCIGLTKDQLYYSYAAVQAIENQIVECASPSLEDPLRTFERMLKYVNKGWTVGSSMMRAFEPYFPVKEAKYEL